MFRRHLEKHGNVSLVGPDDRKPEPLDLDRRDRSGGTEEEVRAVRTDRTFFPEPMAASCQAPQRVPVRLESAIDGFDARSALVAQSHIENPSDENGHELRSGDSKYLQDFPAGFPNVVEWNRIVRNAQGLGGGVDEVSNVEVIEVPDGLLAETPNCEKSLDHGSEGLGTR